MKLINNNTLLTALTVLFFLFPLSGYAMSIDQAKSQGFIGEQASGYLGIVKAGAPKEVHDEMEKVNKEREK